MITAATVMEKANPADRVAGSGEFSNNRTIAQYAAEIWKAQPCPVS